MMLLWSRYPLYLKYVLEFFQQLRSKNAPEEPAPLYCGGKMLLEKSANLFSQSPRGAKYNIVGGNYLAGLYPFA